MKEDNKYYALAMDEYNGETSSKNCYNQSNDVPKKKCLSLISHRV